MDHQVISIDANFGLTRKMNAGHSYEPPKHGTRCFLSEEDTSRFVTKYNDDTTQNGVNIKNKLFVYIICIVMICIQ